MSSKHREEMVRKAVARHIISQVHDSRVSKQHRINSGTTSTALALLTAAFAASSTLTANEDEVEWSQQTVDAEAMLLARIVQLQHEKEHLLAQVKMI